MSVYEQSSQDSIVFFSKIAATFTHDIKNVLAIINENAGLLEDLSLMVDKGYPLNLEKILNITGKVQSQIQRADTMVSRMNIFAHSNDSPEGPIDLKDAVELLLAMTKRILAKKNVTFTIITAEEGPFIVISRPFHILNFLWFCIEKTVEFCDDKRNITIECKKSPDALLLNMTGIKEDQILPLADGDTFMQLLGITYSFDSATQKHQFSFPISKGKEQ